MAVENNTSQTTHSASGGVPPSPPGGAAPEPAAALAPAAPAGAAYSANSSFQPRVEAEEGEPTRFDYVVLALVIVLVVAGLLWAFGVFDIPGLPF